MTKKARVIAFYLPQYHPIPENDLWWGKGFTEWTNVAKAKPSFRGHVQPKIPTDLGFYDLRLPEVRKAQAELAKEYGIEGFCYWHYWFGNGKRLLERPFSEVLSMGEPDFPFCLGWANHSWTNKTWEKNKVFQNDTVFMEQVYGNEEDYINHFYTVLDAFKDERYITVDGKPLFFIFNPSDIPDLEHFIELWRKLAVDNGLAGIHFVGKVASVGRFDRGITHNYLLDAKKNYDYNLNRGLDAVNSVNLRRAEMLAIGKYSKMFERLINKLIPGGKVEKYDYRKIIDNLFTEEDKLENIYPTIIPRWDKTPRVGKRAYVYTNSTPELFARSVRNAVKMIEHKQPEHRILFLQAWNEWGEGNFMEPDLEFGRGYLEALKKEIID
ncbi:glycoside hydrolase family 99-like domain-containing protein [[Clostridium] spiroforme]|nr:glycoside hydrolase family 99-like domain-containing protein [Thomasclavelia spiroformis]